MSRSRWWLGVACAGLCAMPVVATGESDLVFEEVLIRGDGVHVTREDIERYIEVRIPEEQRAAALARPDAIRQLISQLFITRTLATESMGAPGLDMEALEWRAELERDRVLRDALIDLRVAERAERTEWEALAREHYTANVENYEVREQVRVSHVLIDVSERDDDEAKRLAAEIASRAEAGEDFAELARAYSDDPTAAANGGDLGFFAQGQMVPEFEQAAFAMEREGQVAGPIKTQFGYHVIRFTGRLEKGVRPFEEVRASIIRDLRARQARDVRESEVERVRAADRIAVDHEAVERLEAELRAEAKANVD